MSAMSMVTIVSLICAAVGVATNVTMLMYAATGLGCVSMGFPLLRLALSMWTRRAGAPVLARPVARVLA